MEVTTAFQPISWSKPSFKPRHRRTNAISIPRPGTQQLPNGYTDIFGFSDSASPLPAFYTAQAFTQPTVHIISYAASHPPTAPFNFDYDVTACLSERPSRTRDLHRLPSRRPTKSSRKDPIEVATPDLRTLARVKAAEAAIKETIREIDASVEVEAWEVERRASASSNSTTSTGYLPRSEQLPDSASAISSGASSWSSSGGEVVDHWVRKHSQDSDEDEFGVVFDEDEEEEEEEEDRTRAALEDEQRRRAHQRHCGWGGRGSGEGLDLYSTVFTPRRNVDAPSATPSSRKRASKPKAIPKSCRQDSAVGFMDEELEADLAERYARNLTSAAATRRPMLSPPPPPPPVVRVGVRCEGDVATRVAFAEMLAARQWPAGWAVRVEHRGTVAMLSNDGHAV